MKHYRKLTWPCNLWSTILEKEVSEDGLPHDWEAALDHVLSGTHYKNAHEMLLLYFREGANLREISKRFGVSPSAIDQKIDRTIRAMREANRRVLLGYGLEDGAELSEALRADEELSSAASIAVLELSTRVGNALGRAGIKTVGDLRRQSERDLGGVRDLGRKGLREIKERLEAYEKSLPPNNGKNASSTEGAAMRRLVADIGAIRAELARSQVWESDERIASYLLSRGWVLPTRCCDCNYKFYKQGHDKTGCPLDGRGLMQDGDFCSCGTTVGEEAARTPEASGEEGVAPND